MSRIDEFKAFVNKYPLLKNEVRSKNTTWQDIYNEWALYGETKEYEKYLPVEEKNLNSLNFDSIKSITSYIKTLNPDQVNKTLSTIGKVIQIVQNVGTKTPTIPPINGLYSDWWD